MELESRCEILDTFRGWNGHSVYQLTNGQVWKQCQDHCQYHYAYMPKVKVWHDGSKYFLEVNGMDEMVEVRRATISDIEAEEKQIK